MPKSSIIRAGIPALLIGVGAVLGFSPNLPTLFGGGLTVVGALLALVLFLVSGKQNEQSWSTVFVSFVGVVLSGVIVIGSTTGAISSPLDPAPGVAQTSEEPAAIGEVVKVGDWHIKITNLSSDITHELVDDGQTPPPPGMKYAVAGVSIVYVGTSEYAPLTRLNFRAVADDGYFYPFNTLATPPLPIDPFADAVAGVTVEGNLLFEIPIDTQTFGIRVFADSEPPENFG